MSIAERATSSRPAAAASPHALFGAGGSEPYARALRRSEQSPLVLRESQHGTLTSRITMDVDRWHADADATDLALLGAVTGPVLDIGCGPGRMVRGAAALGLDVLGIDVSPAAIEVARASGLTVVEASVFEEVPNAGRWHTALLVDGNIGIGGDVIALLERCRELITPSGEIVVELHVDPTTDREYIASLVDSDGGASELFPWAEVGLDRIAHLAPQLRLALRHAWVSEGRSFCRLVATCT
ncbi:methyltransferase family protein [Glaciihabitans tibetensis]|uniref:Methyltransferase family protein n=1 Tax=Glaciihabitans tibetensis TaxID=1266600 RepID=A0A2T0VAT6_9MICO|nr:class I SAM-dependent methyltransferase [Glaciihabitans tibetensis]PRY67306.1 methyltransferase family protein [Glaciihabitans tibetensis]